MDNNLSAKFKVKLLQSDRVLAVDGTTTLLESLESELVPVESQCRVGYCGACRMRLVSGQVSYHPTPLASLKEGEILPCCSKPSSNLILEY